MIKEYLPKKMEGFYIEDYFKKGEEK